MDRSGRKCGIYCDDVPTSRVHSILAIHALLGCTRGRDRRNVDNYKSCLCGSLVQGAKRLRTRHLHDRFEFRWFDNSVNIASNLSEARFSMVHVDLGFPVPWLFFDRESHHEG